MAEIERTTETVVAAPVENGVTTERIATHSSGPLAKTEMVIYYLLGLLEALLAIRFVLSLLGANRSNGFAHAIYAVTAPFVAPFQSLFFGAAATANEYRLEIGTLAAMVVYALIAWAIAKLLRIGRS